MPLINLRDGIKISYRSERDKVVSDFYIPCLKESFIYDRAVGYFTSASLSLVARGVVHMIIKNRGKMRLIASPDMSDEDVITLRNSDEDKIKLFSRIAQRSMNDLISKVESDCMSALAWMVSEKMLEIKLAYPKTGRGIYHEKIGIFRDNENNSISFRGSGNETAGGLVNNYESISCFTSWKEPERVNEMIDDFEELWAGRSRILDIIDFTAASDQLFKKYKGTQTAPIWTAPRFNPDDFGVEPEWLDRRLKLPLDSFSRREYQNIALNKWTENKGRGILAMATGTGKTKTALLIAQHVSSNSKNNDRLWIVVICPYVNLCSQWEEEIKKWGTVPVGCYGNSASWSNHLESKLIQLRDQVLDVVFTCVTNDSFRSPSFQQIISRFKDAKLKLFIIGDEVHNLGTSKMQDALPDWAKIRLGLSATPVRAHDQDGTEFLQQYFGETVFEFSLKKAIEEGFLTRYDYYPIPILLTENEAIAYADITRRLARYSLGSNAEMSEAVQALLIERARITGAAANKIIELKKLVETNRPKSALFYCSDGTTESEGHDHEGKQLRNVIKALGDSGVKVRAFTSNESTEEREVMLRSVKSGTLDGLVAIRCLDEGIDVPSLSTAYILASSTNPRQSIQRRGRILRPSPGKTKAVIYDFFVVPPDLSKDYGLAGRRWERSLFGRELTRILEFCECANNGITERAKLLDLRQAYDLMDL